ncbi:flagellar hook-basal body protein [Paenibacillus sp. GM2]|uniref:flagellar hook-basal body protein n=1 Tax=Paenibacillus sp. GM2 TaxID=1622070 RepID=UPI0008385B2E|nr:flagellar hook-basal body protein [Paenibacillus sp. GM2]
MIRGLYTAASGMITEQRRHDTITQNIANLNTPGYKQVSSVSHSFPETLISIIGDKQSGNNRKIGKLATGVFAEESLASYAQGDLKETGKKSDFALLSSIGMNHPATGELIPFDASGKYVGDNGEVFYRPEAFFTVMDKDNQLRYTRDGNFTVAPDGALLTSQGYRVLDMDHNPVVLPAGVSIDSLQSDSVGRLFYYNEAGIREDVGNLGISVADRPQELVRDGNGVYRELAGLGTNVRPLTNREGAEVRQGYLEVSNVDPAQSMVDLMAAQRAYESNQKIVQYYDKSLDKAVNEVGRI